VATAVPAPTQQLYVVQPNDTMSRIAKRFGLPLQALIDANKATVPNPDKVKIGDTLIIPVTTPTTLPGVGPSASP
jgi:LysM repeat protein